MGCSSREFQTFDLVIQVEARKVLRSVWYSAWLMSTCTTLQNYVFDIDQPTCRIAGANFQHFMFINNSSFLCCLHFYAIFCNFAQKQEQEMELQRHLSCNDSWFNKKLLDEQTKFMLFSSFYSKKRVSKIKPVQTQTWQVTSRFQVLRKKNQNFASFQTSLENLEYIAQNGYYCYIYWDTVMVLYQGTIQFKLVPSALS